MCVIKSQYISYFFEKTSVLILCTVDSLTLILLKIKVSEDFILFFKKIGHLQENSKALSKSRQRSLNYYLLLKGSLKLNGQDEVSRLVLLF